MVMVKIKYADGNIGYKNIELSTENPLSIFNCFQCHTPCKLKDMVEADHKMICDKCQERMLGVCETCD